MEMIQWTLSWLRLPLLPCQTITVVVSKCCTGPMIHVFGKLGVRKSFYGSEYILLRLGFWIRNKR